MTNRTERIRTAELIRDVSNHPHRDELINLMFDQLNDDNVRVDTNVVTY